MIVFNSYLNSLVLATLSEHLSSGGFSGPLYNVNLALIAANFAPAPTSKFTDFTEATYSGYARVTGLTWGTPILQGDGTYTMLSALETFIASAASNFLGNVIWGYAVIDNSATPNLLFAEAFGTPVPIASPGDGFGLVVKLNQGANNGASTADVIAAT